MVRFNLSLKIQNGRWNYRTENINLDPLTSKSMCNTSFYRFVGVRNPLLTLLLLYEVKNICYGQGKESLKRLKSKFHTH